jgi:two-component system cell cycle sensor histidine kinase PleC
MSHELRTPLNAIIGFSDLMCRQEFGAIDNPQYRDYLQHIWKSGLHLLDLINDILDMSKIESGRFQLERDKVDPARVIGEVTGLLGDRARDAGVTLRTAIASNLPCLWADERRLKQILLNLLSNAIKFTPAGGTVTVQVQPAAGGDIRIAIADTGIGIPEDQIKAVLLPFTQVNSELNRKHSGTGLGLPIARSLTEMHGGTFTVTSELGRGTTVALVLPGLRTAAVRAAR